MLTLNGFVSNLLLLILFSSFYFIFLLSVSTTNFVAECGKSKYPNPAPEQKTDRFGRVVGGWEARVNEFPYQVSEILHSLK